MTYRNDHDAALARAEALQEELERERAKHEAEQVKLARELQVERAARVRAEQVARVDARFDKVTLDEMTPVTRSIDRRPLDVVAICLTLAILLVLVLFVLALAIH